MLTQLLVSIGIIALLSTLSIPFLRQYQTSFKLNSTAKELASDLRQAQQLTVSEQNVHYLQMDIINASYNIIKQDGVVIIKTVALDPTINFQTITGFDNNRVVFNSYGAVSQSGNIVLINPNNDTTTVEVKPSGYVRVQ